MTGQVPPPAAPGPVQPSPPPPGWMPPPLGGGAPPPATPEPAWAPPTGWPAPTAPGYGAPGLPVPTGGGSPGRRPRGRVALAAAIGVVVVVGAAVGVWTLQGGFDQPPTPSASAPTAPVDVTGGDVGTPVTLTGPDGTATVTVSAATWTPEGELEPAEGASYLVVDVEVRGTAGAVAVGGVFTVAVAEDGSRHSLAYGPVLERLLPSTRLREGESAQGQLGYQLPPGPVRIEFQDPSGTVLGTIAVPGP